MGREAGHRGVEGPATGEPSEADRDLGAVLGRKQGGANDVGYDSRRRHAARGTEHYSLRTRSEERPKAVELLQP